METTINFVFAYSLSTLFLIFVTVSSLTHLWINNKKFNVNYKLMMWIFVPISLLSMFSIIFSFEFRPNQVWPSTAIFLALSVVSGTFKSLFPRNNKSVDADSIREVLGKFTPKYPSDSTENNNIFRWHIQLDMLALIGLWVFILLDHTALPWILEGVSLSR